MPYYIFFILAHPFLLSPPYYSLNKSSEGQFWGTLQAGSGSARRWPKQGLFLPRCCAVAARSSGPCGARCTRCLSGLGADPCAGSGWRRGPGAISWPWCRAAATSLCSEGGSSRRGERGGTAFKYKSKPSVTGNPEKVARDINRGYNCSDNQGCSCKYSLSFLI